MSGGGTTHRSDLSLTFPPEKDAPATTALPDPQERLRSAIAKELGSGRKGVPRLSEVALGDDLSISWAIGESLTEGLTKDKARREATQILETVRKQGVTYRTISLVGSYQLVDRLDNSSEDTVVRATYGKATVDRINFSGFDFKNVFDIAATAIIHPAFRY